VLWRSGAPRPIRTTGTRKAAIGDDQFNDRAVGSPFLLLKKCRFAAEQRASASHHHYRPTRSCAAALFAQMPSDVECNRHRLRPKRAGFTCMKLALPARNAGATIFIRIANATKSLAGCLGTPR
jgi:hypothetical protein